MYTLHIYFHYSVGFSKHFEMMLRHQLNDLYSKIDGTIFSHAFVLLIDMDISFHSHHFKTLFSWGFEFSSTD